MALDLQLICRKPIPTHDASDCPGEPMERPSTRHPSHSFRMGHFVSPSQPSAFNTVIRKTAGEDLFSIFGFRSTTASVFQPDWHQVKHKVNQIRQKLNQHKEDCGGFHNVHAVRRPPNVPDRPNSEHQAFELFRSEVKQSRIEKFNFGDFTSEKGDFLLTSPWKVVALLPADPTSDTLCYIICEEDLTWYLEALDIIEETADFVLSQSDGGCFYLCWSE